MKRRYMEVVTVAFLFKARLINHSSKELFGIFHHQTLDQLWIKCYTSLHVNSGGI